MDKLKISIHPLFFVFGLYFAFLGKVFSFLVFALTATIHEFGHMFASLKLGYRLNKIVLMPHGALISGNIDDISYKDECLIALAGPLINICVGFVFVALWWFFPDIYPYTDTAVLANFSIAIINLIPCYPLDGGRFLFSTLSMFISRKTANLICKILGLALSFFMFALFVFSMFTTINFTLLFFALFMIIGVLDNNKNHAYIKVLSTYNFDRIISYKLVKNIIVNGKVKVKNLIALLDSSYYYIVTICLDNGEKRILQGNELLNFLLNSSVYNSLNECFEATLDNSLLN